MGKIVKAKIKRGKETFELFLKNEGNPSVYYNQAKMYNLSYQTIRCDVFEYMKNVLQPRPTEEELNLYHRYSRRNIKTPSVELSKFPHVTEEIIKQRVQIIKELLVLKTVGDLVLYAIKSELSIGKLDNEIEQFIKYNEGKLSDTELKKLENIKLKLIENDKRIYDARREISVKEVTKTKTAETSIIVRNLIKEYLTENIIDFDVLLKRNNITKGTVYKYLDIIKLEDATGEQLYQDFCLKTEEIEAKILRDYLELYEYVTNGIVKNNVLTSLTLLDYFRITNCICPDYFSKVGQTLAKKAKIHNKVFRVVQNFLIRHRNFASGHIQAEKEDFIKVKFAISGVESSVNDKEIIWEYFEKNNIPPTKHLLTLALEENIKNLFDYKVLTFE